MKESATPGGSRLEPCRVEHRQAAALALVLLRVVCATDNCSSAQFPLDLDGQQCHGLRSASFQNGLDGCLAACCAASDCAVYQYCPGGAGCPQANSCWIGPLNSSCFDSPGWQSRARPAASGPYRLSDEAGYWPFPYAGIGAISGGGATSNLLFAYPEQFSSEILDFLFLPNFGAALQLLKVEIGGDGLSTEGSEASHWRSRSEAPAYDRGYEWRISKYSRRGIDRAKMTLEAPRPFSQWSRRRSATLISDSTVSPGRGRAGSLLPARRLRSTM